MPHQKNDAIRRDGLRAKVEAKRGNHSFLKSAAASPAVSQRVTVERTDGLEIFDGHKLWFLGVTLGEVVSDGGVEERPTKCLAEGCDAGSCLWWWNLSRMRELSGGGFAFKGLGLEVTGLWRGLY